MIEGGGFIMCLDKNFLLDETVLNVRDGCVKRWYKLEIIFVLFV